MLKARILSLLSKTQHNLLDFFGIIAWKLLQMSHYLSVLNASNKCHMFSSYCCYLTQYLANGSLPTYAMPQFPNLSTTSIFFFK